MLLVVCFGWQLVGSRYWFLSVSFLNISVSILPSLMLHSVSKNETDSIGSHSHCSEDSSSLIDVCVIVSCIVGLIWLMEVFGGATENHENVI